MQALAAGSQIAGDLKMATLWPWIVISCGIVGLFGYRFAADWQRWLDIAKGFLRPAVTHAEGKDIEESRPKRRKAPVMVARERPPVHHAWMPAVISLLVLLSALYIILSNDGFGDAQQKWAFGAVGTILGYWLKR